MKIVAFILVLMYMSKEGYSLECYTCNDCQRGFMNGDDAVQDCGSDLFNVAQCFKEVEDDGDVNRGCSEDVTCTFKATTGYECTDTRTTDCYICCTGDKCNSASVTTISAVILFGTLIMVVFLHLQ